MELESTRRTLESTRLSLESTWLCLESTRLVCEFASNFYPKNHALYYFLSSWLNQFESTQAYYSIQTFSVLKKFLFCHCSFESTHVQLELTWEHASWNSYISKYFFFTILAWVDSDKIWVDSNDSLIKIGVHFSTWVAFWLQFLKAISILIFEIFYSI